MNQRAPQGLYLDFPGFGKEKDEPVRSAYGPNYDRLTRLKTLYDPGNIFRHNQNIKPASTVERGI